MAHLCSYLPLLLCGIRPDECPKMLDKSVKKKRPHPSLEKIQESVELLWIGSAYDGVSARDRILRIDLS